MMVGLAKVVEDEANACQGQGDGDQGTSGKEAADQLLIKGWIDQAATGELSWDEASRRVNALKAGEDWEAKGGDDEKGDDDDSVKKGENRLGDNGSDVAAGSRVSSVPVEEAMPKALGGG